MPRFTLDLRFTEEGLKKFRNNEHREIRDNHAKPFARDNGLAIISITDRPVGPIWIVEGEESAVKKVLDRFNNPPNTPHGPTVRATIV